ILQECYDGCTTTLIPFQREVPVAVGKGVRQGDPVSPNLSSAVLEDVISRCNWEERGIHIDGRQLGHLRFADDIVLVTSTLYEASEMLAELDIVSHAVGLKMNTKKTKAMHNCFATSAPITIGATQLEDVEEYVYLDRLINSQNKLKPELARRKRAGWAAFSSIRTVIDSTKDVKLRAQLFDSTILPTLCYGAETWSLTKSLANQFTVAHASLERHLVGLSLWQQRDRKFHNSNTRQMSGVKDPLQHVTKMKHRWACHVARRCDGRWSTTTVGWYPRDKKRPLSRPPPPPPGGAPPTWWADSLATEYNIRDARGRTRVHWTTRARDRVERSRCWDPRAS
uniref:Reverse transcriptase domain-containing protein n=1 Tax=Plectus sambesii TaxID=2011161 RepID=A0A914V545_9BILA